MERLNGVWVIRLMLFASIGIFTICGSFGDENGQLLGG